MQNHYDAPVNVFARYAAHVLGGEAVPFNADRELTDWTAEVVLPAAGERPACSLIISTRDGGAPKRYVVALYAPRDYKASSLPSRAGEITVSATRDPQAVCLDIHRRLVNDADTLQKLRRISAARDEEQDRARRLESQLAELKAACPNATDLPHYPPSGGTVRVFGTGSGTGFDGVLYADGAMTFSRISSLPADKARRILAILAEEESA